MYPDQVQLLYLLHLCVVKCIYVVFQLEQKVMERFEKVSFHDIVFTTIKDVIIIDRKTDKRGY